MRLGEREKRGEGGEGRGTAKEREVGEGEAENVTDGMSFFLE